MNMPAEIHGLLAPAIGLECKQISVGRHASLSVGLGRELEEVVECDMPRKRFEWEIGKYYSGWRILKDGKILCGSSDEQNVGGDLSQFIKLSDVGRLCSLEQANSYDINVRFDGGIEIQFICLSADDDEIFHVFCPNSMYIQLHFVNGWESGRSDVPWPDR